MFLSDGSLICVSKYFLFSISIPPDQMVSQDNHQLKVRVIRYDQLVFQERSKIKMEYQSVVIGAFEPKKVSQYEESFDQ